MILFRNEESDLLPIMSFEIEFQSFAPSYMKLFFILLVLGFGKQRLLVLNMLVCLLASV